MLIKTILTFNLFRKKSKQGGPTDYLEESDSVFYLVKQIKEETYEIFGSISLKHCFI